MVETSFANGNEFATVEVTPTGRIVVASAEARLREDRGIWLPIGKT